MNDFNMGLISNPNAGVNKKTPLTMGGGIPSLYSEPGASESDENKAGNESDPFWLDNEAEDAHHKADEDTSSAVSPDAIISKQFKESPIKDMPRSLLFSGELTDRNSKTMLLSKGKAVGKSGNSLVFDSIATGINAPGVKRKPIEESELNSEESHELNNAEDLEDDDEEIIAPAHPEPYSLRDVNGTQIGIIDLDVALMDAPPMFRFEGADVLRAKTVLDKFIPEIISNGANKVILFSNKPQEHDNRLAGMVDGIDLIIGRKNENDEISAPGRQGKTLIYPAPSSIPDLDYLDISWDHQDHSPTRMEGRIERVNSDIIIPDKQTMDLLESYKGNYFISRKYEKWRQPGLIIGGFKNKIKRYAS
jgi:hypothetical protein